MGRFNYVLGEKRTFYKEGDVTYELPKKLKFIKESKRDHTVFRGWCDLTRLYKDEHFGGR